MWMGDRGHHSDLKPVGSPMSTSAAVVKIAKLQVLPEPSHTPEFWEAEGMGVLPAPRCDTCTGCMKTGKCSERHFNYGINPRLK